jgi:hypothetical protein
MSNLRFDICNNRQAKINPYNEKVEMVIEVLSVSDSSLFRLVTTAQ